MDYVDLDLTLDDKFHVAPLPHSGVKFLSFIVMSFYLSIIWCDLAV